MAQTARLLSFSFIQFLGSYKLQIGKQLIKRYIMAHDHKATLYSKTLHKAYKYKHRATYSGMDFCMQNERWTTMSVL